MQISRGRTEPCKDTISGIKSVYIWRWVKYSFTQITAIDGVSLSNYPSTVVFKYDTVIDGNNYEENLIEDNAYEQKLNVVLKKQDLATLQELNRLQKGLIGCFVEDYNGLFRLMGMYNGCELDGINVSSGGGKSDFNGYNLEINAKEWFKAPLFSNLNDVGFTLDTDGGNYLLDEIFNILTDGNNNRLIYA